jgi:hypothetical protein
MAWKYGGRSALAFMIAVSAWAAGNTEPATLAKQRSLFVDACTACHTLERVRAQHLSADEWRKLIAGMLSEGVPLTEEETTLLVEYLAKNFGPDQPHV